MQFYEYVAYTIKDNDGKHPLLTIGNSINTRVNRTLGVTQSNGYSLMYGQGQDLQGKGPHWQHNNY